LLKNKDYHTVQSYVTYLNEVINQTLTDSRLSCIKSDNPDHLLIVRFQDGKRLPLDLSPHGLLFFHQKVSILNNKVRVEDCGYCYSLSPNPDNEKRKLFRYEYNLSPDLGVPHSHLHVNANWRGKCQIPCKDIHFPTERISIEKVLWCLFAEFEVVPRITDWFDILSKSHMHFTGLRIDPPMFP
jgi:hypothetical protein